MFINIKKYITSRLNKLEIIINTPGAYKARKSGCYLEFYAVVYNIFRRSIKPETIIDIGANRGMFVKCANCIFPEATIYAFEPLKEPYHELCKLKKKIPKLECYNIAIGEKSEEITIYKNNYDYSSSLLEMNDLHKNAFPYTAELTMEKVEVKTLDNVLSGKNLEKPILMKIDVQGYEKFVLNGSQETLKHVNYVICELSFFELYKGQALFNDVYNMFIEYGFNFFGQLGELRHPETDQTLQIDAFFIKNNL